MKFSSLFFMIFLFVLNNTNAQNIPDLVTDRPDITESAVLVPTNYTQIETGFEFNKQKFPEKNENIEIDNLIFASTLIRYGISEMFELRFGGEYVSNKVTQDNLSFTSSGLRGLFVGTKISIMKDQDIINDLAIILEANLPYGNENLRPEKFEPILKITAAKNISELFSVGINLGVENNSSINKNIYIYSSSLCYEISQTISAYLELYGSLVDKFYPEHFFDAGITYLHKQNIQLDLSAGSIIFNEIFNWFGSFGISLRLPN